LDARLAELSSLITRAAAPDTVLARAAAD